MNVIWRIVGALFIGILFYAVLLIIVIRFALPLAVLKILIWNIIIFGFWGRGEPVGFMPNGAPIYDGTVGFLGFSTESILTGFFIYPILFFIGLSIFYKIKQRNN